LAKYYIWFVVVVAGMAGAIRLLMPRRFAELQLQRMDKTSPAGSLARSLLFVAVGILFGSLYFTSFGHQTWVAIGAIFSFLSAGEAVLQTQFRGLDALIYQSRLLGILYLGLAAGSYVIASRL
jgi:hypothetical protein